MVDDAHQGKGIATLLLEHLAAIAAANGIVRFTAEVLADNRPMLAVFARAGWPLQRRFDSGVIEVDFPLADTAEFVDSVSRREQRADSRAMARLLLPRAIAVVGATDRPGSVGAALWRNVTAAATVPVYAGQPATARPSATTPVLRQRHATSRDVISLAVIAVPADALDAGDRRLHRRTRPRRRGRDLGRRHGRRPRRARRQGPQQRHAHHRSVEHGRRRRRARRSVSDARSCPQQLPEGGVAISHAVRARSAPRSCELAKQQRARPVVVRVARRQARRVGQRPAAVLGGRRDDAGDRHVHRVRSATRASSPASPGASRSTGPIVAVRTGAAAIGPTTARCTSTAG